MTKVDQFRLQLKKYYLTTEERNILCRNFGNEYDTFEEMLECMRNGTAKNFRGIGPVRYSELRSKLLGFELEQKLRFDQASFAKHLKNLTDSDLRSMLVCLKHELDLRYENTLNLLKELA